jgi:hypothetical protein
MPIARAAELLGEDEELQWKLAEGMEPEDGCLWIHGVGYEQTIACTCRGLEYLQEILAKYKQAGGACGPNRMLKEMLHLMTHLPIDAVINGAAVVSDGSRSLRRQSRAGSNDPRHTYAVILTRPTQTPSRKSKVPGNKGLHLVCEGN